MNAHNDVIDTFGRLRQLARERRPNDPLIPAFLGEYYREVPPEDADERDLDDAYAAACAHLQLGRRRAAGQTLVEVLSPDVDRDGWETDRTHLMFVTDDVPFLVDTVRMVLDQHGLGIHLLVHPMLLVERDQQHRIVSIGRAAGRGLLDVEEDSGRVEAWTQIELDRCPPEDCDQLEADVLAAIEGVRRVVGDFPQMRERLLDVSGGNPLLDWLADGNFVFLGAVTYRREGEQLDVVAGSELGEFRAGRMDPNLSLIHI